MDYQKHTCAILCAVLSGLSASSVMAQTTSSPGGIREQMEQRMEEMMKEGGVPSEEEMRQQLQDRMAEMQVKRDPMAHPDDAALGILLRPITKEERKELGLRRGVGMRVAKVVPGSPSAKAGFKDGDIVESIEGQWIFNAPQMQALIRSFNPSNRVSIRGMQGDARFDRPVTLVRARDLPRKRGSKYVFDHDFDFDSNFDFDFDSDSDSSFDFDSDSASDRKSSTSSTRSSKSKTRRGSSTATNAVTVDDSDRIYNLTLSPRGGYLVILDDESDVLFKGNIPPSGDVSGLPKWARTTAKDLFEMANGDSSK